MKILSDYLKEQRAALKKPIGAPSKRTPQAMKIICDCLARGMPQGMAASVAGISAPTFYKWKESDPAFKDEVEVAVALGVNARLRKIEESSADDWRAAAWLLEHCQPAHFAKNRLEITGADGSPLAAGIQLYLPKKDTPAVESEPVDIKEVPELTEGGQQ